MSIINEVSKSAGQFAKKELKQGRTLVGFEKSEIQQADEFLKKLPGAEISTPKPIPLDENIEVPKELKKLFGNPDTIEYKAKYNKKGRFSIVGFLAKKNGKTVSKGAVSLTDGGSKDAVLKTHIVSGKNGSRMTFNAFVDSSKEVETADLRLSQLEKGLGLDVKAGDAAAAHVEVGTSQVGNLFKTSKLEGNITNNNVTDDANAAIKAVRHSISEQDPVYYYSGPEKAEVKYFTTK